MSYDASRRLHGAHGPLEDPSVGHRGMTPRTTGHRTNFEVMGMREVREGVILEVKVFPGSKRRGLKFEEGRIVCHLKSKPERGKANEELIKTLREIFSHEVEIISGKRSRRKEVLIRGAKVEEVEEKLKGL